MSRAGATLLAGAQVPLEDFPVDVAWSPDSRQLVVAGGEGRLYRVDAGDGSAVLMGEQPPGLLSVVWQPGGKLLATAGQDGAVLRWDATTPGAAPQRLHRGMGWPAGLAFQPRGKALAFALGKQLQVLDLEGQVLASLGPHEVGLTHLVWRSVDEIIAVGNGALFTDRLAPQPEIARHVLEGSPLCLALSPDGRVAAAGLQDGQLQFRMLAAGKRSRMSGYDGKVPLLAWSGNSRYLASTSTGNPDIVVWDFGGKGPEGSAPIELRLHAERVEALAFQPAGNHLVSTGRDWRVVLWKPGPGAQAAEPLDVQLLDGPASLARWSPDGRQVAIAQASGRLRVFSIRS
ncbi:MAG: hypothetical protein RL026_33 [Pseudomonadota bacterium]